VLERLLISVCDRARVSVGTRRDCEILSALILESTDEFISYNTLRRLYGLAQPVKPRQQTLDALARYCGFPHYQAFATAQGGAAKWTVSEEVFHRLESGDMDGALRLVASIPGQLERMDLYVQMSRELILTKRLDEFGTMFQSPLINVGRWEYSHQLHYGIAIGMLLPSVPQQEHPLLRMQAFLESVYLTHVNYNELNGYYGAWTEYLLEDPPSAEIRCFALCLRALRNFLNDDTLSELPQLDPTTASLHPILRSRIFSVHWLAGRRDFEVLWEQVHGPEGPDQIPLIWLHEISVVALLLDDRELMARLMRLSVAPERLAHYEDHHRQLILLCSLGAALKQGRRDDALALDAQFRLQDITRGYRDLVEWTWNRLRLEMLPRSRKPKERMQHLAEKLGYPYLSRS